jgi:translation initiation factor 2B subunit (eIF-2B alpha/beta/delta family)
MLPKRIRVEVEKLRRDNRSGAADIALSAVAIVQRYLRETTVRDKREFLDDLRELCGGLLFAQLAMSSLRNACVDILSTLSKHRDGDNIDKVRHELEKKLERVSRHISLAPKRIADHLSRAMPSGGRILTLSYSSTVMGVLKELKRRGKRLEVVVMESRPMLEGRLTAHQLARAKILTTLIADAALGEYARKVDMAVVGADTVYSDGSTVNKVGTFPVAVCCRELKKPLFVLADSSKITTEHTGSFTIEEKTPGELLRDRCPGLTVKNFYFELTPAKYITAIVSEKGVFSPHAMRKKSAILGPPHHAQKV